MRAGKHFPTDVLTGVLVGGAVGTLVPYLHRTPGGGDAKRTSEAATTPLWSFGGAF
jgi:membrane-associated phospholipid phosphatase